MKGTGIIITVDQGAIVEKKHVVVLVTMKDIVQIINLLATRDFIQKIRDLEIGDQCMKEEGIRDRDQEIEIISTIEADEVDPKVMIEIVQDPEDTAVLEVVQKVDGRVIIFIQEDLEQTLIKLNF